MIRETQTTLYSCFHRLSTHCTWQATPSSHVQLVQYPFNIYNCRYLMIHYEQMSTVLISCATTVLISALFEEQFNFNYQQLCIQPDVVCACLFAALFHTHIFFLFFSVPFCCHLAMKPFPQRIIERSSPNALLCQAETQHHVMIWEHSGCWLWSSGAVLQISPLQNKKNAADTGTLRGGKKEKERTRWDKIKHSWSPLGNWTVAATKYPRKKQK